jgi:hypothetical protein
MYVALFGIGIKSLHGMYVKIFRSTDLQICVVEVDADFEQSTYGSIIHVTKQTTSAERSGFSDLQLSEANVCNKYTVATSYSPTTCSDIPATSTSDTPAASSCGPSVFQVPVHCLPFKNKP